MSGRNLFIDAQRISKHFGSQVALRQVDLQAHPAESIAVLGANGAGKSTLLRILATLSRPSRGSYQAFQTNAWTARSEIRTRLGVIGHQPFLYPELTVQENLKFYASMFKIKDQRTRIEKILGDVGLTDRRNTRAETLSRGLLQRLDLARSVLHQPSVLIYDEPDTGLDSPGRTILSSLIRNQIDNRGTVLFSTHALEFALANATRIFVLRSGSVSLDVAGDAVDIGEIELAIGNTSGSRVAE